MKKDHLSNKVSVNAQLTETGITAEAKSRTIAALDRLGGSLLDVPIAYLENRVDQIRGKRNNSFVDEGLEQIANGQDSEIEKKLMAGLVEERIRPLVNKLYVIEKTIEELGSNTEKNEDLDTDREVDSDWLNYFRGYAEKASTEAGRARWAKILAGEIRQPGTFSIRALRFLTEVDQDTAAIFAETTRLRFNNGEYILRPNDSYQEDFLNRLRLLEQEGLLDQISPNSGISWTPSELTSEGFLVVVEGGLCLRIHTSKKVKFGVIPLTRLGKEITILLDPVDPMAVLQNLANAVPQNIETVDICQFVKHPQGNDVSILLPPIVNLRR